MSESDTARAALVERMARALATAMGQNPDETQGDPYCESDNGSWPLWAEYQRPASAALDIALEEAARVAECPQPKIGCHCDYCAGRRHAATAIRALIKQNI